MHWAGKSRMAEATQRPKGAMQRASQRRNPIPARSTPWLVGWQAGARHLCRAGFVEREKE